ncbi:hypothetical protein BDV96DRAFT_628649 [Lophiotrema nucula]|uniref:AMP-dependent synthetase/ligase domain-containing protein n=1 Tax=Lophiotrema nucula TaxID=690887 RepID=A0A6A5ZMK9_9PLEO|nr:hypothetical protein BDV96DRAFT_628649 [Lophiotrema nucula]
MSYCCVVTFDELLRLSRDEQNTVQPIPEPDPQSTAYMVYTSSSTGTSKGIEISHQAALTFCLSERPVLETGPSDIVWQGFSPAFDMFIEEVWVSIAGGAQLANRLTYVGTHTFPPDTPYASLWGSKASLRMPSIR